MKHIVFVIDISILACITKNVLSQKKKEELEHTFLKGHHLMIQIQSTWFPIIDRNPQKFIPNIFEAKETDFIKATQTIYCNNRYATYIELPVMKE